MQNSHYVTCIDSYIHMYKDSVCRLQSISIHARKNEDILTRSLSPQGECEWKIKRGYPRGVARISSLGFKDILTGR